MNPDEGAALLKGTSFCCPACSVPKTPSDVLLPCAWPKLQPHPAPGLLDPLPNILLVPPPLTAPILLKRALPPAVLALSNGFAAKDAGGLILDLNSLPAEVKAEVFGWLNRLPESPLVADLPNENGALDFAGSDNGVLERRRSSGTRSFSGTRVHRRKTGRGLMGLRSGQER